MNYKYNDALKKEKSNVLPKDIVLTGLQYQYIYIYLNKDNIFSKIIDTLLLIEYPIINLFFFNLGLFS